jgi:putative phosphoribosyl transferase
MFHDRIQAGLLLAAKLKKYKDEPGIVLAVPRGGVPVAYAVAQEFSFSMEVVLTKKIGHPNNKEYAIGAASLDDYFIVPFEHVSENYITTELAQVRSRLKEMNKKFMGNKEPASLEGKTVLVIDDGIATGNTLLGTVQLIRKRKPGKIIVGAPVASKSAVQLLEKEVDEIVVISTPPNFFGVGQFYEDFDEVSDEEVITYLKRLEELRQSGHVG